MEVIKKEATKDTPNVILDAGKGIFEFSGKSLPENVKIFFTPILEWIKAYGESPNAETLVVMKMDYFNTASSKSILDILLAFEDINEEHKGVTVDWYYKEHDEDMEEAGDEYSDIVDLPFNLKSY